MPVFLPQLLPQRRLFGWQTAAVTAALAAGVVAVAGCGASVQGGPAPRLTAAGPAPAAAQRPSGGTITVATPAPNQVSLTSSRFT